MHFLNPFYPLRSQSSAVSCVLIFFVSVFTISWAIAKEEPPPFTLDHAPDFYHDTYIHTGYTAGQNGGYVNQVVHPDLLYFPDGWGNVDGAQYRYWMGINGYYGGNEKYEQPCILVANDISPDNGNPVWCEPADNAYNTNPLLNDVNNRHYSDIELVYNDDTNEIFCYVRNKIGSEERIELVKSSDGVNWTLVTNSAVTTTQTLGRALLSPTVVKEGSDWWLWLVDATIEEQHVLKLYHSPDGVTYTEQGECVIDYVDRNAWHIDIVKYNNEYWGFLVDSADSSGGYTDLYFIKSAQAGDKLNWIGFNEPILGRTDTGWDKDSIYRATFIIEDGYLQAIYSAYIISTLQSSSQEKGAQMYIWHVGYTDHVAVGGSGQSSNIINNANNNP